MESSHKTPSVFGWVDTPWTVAALLGAWGVMIGIEEFFLANVFMVLAGISCTARLAKDCFQHRRRRWLPFFVRLAIIVAVVRVDIHLTGKKKASSEAKAGEIPRLNKEIEDLNKTIQDQSRELSGAQGRTDQHVSDIQEENKRLRASIDKKDAALVSLAKQQFALNFAPQVDAVNEGDPNVLKIVNKGKYAIDLLELRRDGVAQSGAHTPHSIIQGAESAFAINSGLKAEIISKAASNEQTNDIRTRIEFSALIQTRDKKLYLVPFTWTFIVKDGAITRSFATDHPIVEEPSAMPRK
jgi:phage host-nuclease inhibitor protein Gam